MSRRILKIGDIAVKKGHESLKEQESSKLIGFLEQEYPNGISLDPMTLRLLRQKISITDGDLGRLKDSLFQLGNGLWLSSGMVADDDVCLAIHDQAESWLSEYHCFSVDCLFERYSSELQCISTVDDFVVFLRHLGISTKIKYGANWGYYSNTHLSVRECLCDVADRIMAKLEDAGGMLPLVDIEKDFSCFTPSALDVIRRQVLPEVSTAEMDGFVCWRNKDAVHLPEDLAGKITTAVDTLVELEENITPKNLEFALNLLFRFRFREECSLQDNATFKRVCAEHYQGEHEVMSKWKNSSTRTISSHHVSSGRQIRSATTFAMLGIPVGEKLIFTKDDSITCTVVDSTNRVKFDGNQWSISKLACHLLKSNVSGYLYFCYQGETLWKRRKRLEQGGADV